MHAWGTGSCLALKGDVAKEKIVELDAKEADEQIQTAIPKNGDYILIQETLSATVAILRSAKKFNYKGNLIALNWAFTESLIPILSKDSIGYLGLPLFPAGDDSSIKGIKEIVEYTRKTYGPGFRIPSKYIAGWTAGIVITKELEKATKENIPL